MTALGNYRVDAIGGALSSCDPSWPSWNDSPVFFRLDFSASFLPSRVITITNL